MSIGFVVVFSVGGTLFFTFPDLLPPHIDCTRIMIGSYNCFVLTAEGYKMCFVLFSYVLWVDGWRWMVFYDTVLVVWSCVTYLFLIFYLL